MTTAEIAERVLRGYETHVPIDPVRTDVSGLAAVYAVQRATYDVFGTQTRRP
jgi:hypothetical protein